MTSIRSVLKLYWFCMTRYLEKPKRMSIDSYPVGTSIKARLMSLCFARACHQPFRVNVGLISQGISEQSCDLPLTLQIEPDALSGYTQHVRNILLCPAAVLHQFGESFVRALHKTATMLLFLLDGAQQCCYTISMETVNAAKHAVDGFLRPLTDYELKCWIDLYRALIAAGTIPKKTEGFKSAGNHG